MRNNTPPHSNGSPDLEEMLDEDGEVIYLDDIEEGDFHGWNPNDIDDDPPNEIAITEEPTVPERDDSILTFRKHTAPIFSCSIHPERNICVTGGEDDKAYVWDTFTGEVLHEINNHKDTVISTCFNYDGNYLATGDMAGEIQVFKLANDFKKVWEFSMGDMCWLKWHSSANVLIAGADSGEIYIWRIPSGDCKILPGTGKKCETSDLASDGKKLFAGYGDGSVKLWDIKSSSVIVEVDSHNPTGHHNECVSSVACDPDKSLFISGSEDGSILLTSSSGVICTLNQTGSSIECVAFCPDSDLKLAASGALDGQLSIWDVSKQCLRASCSRRDPNFDNGITTLKWLPQQNLICATLKGDICVFDGRSCTQKYSLLGHLAEVYDIYYSNREGIIVTASEDNTAKIFRINI